MKFEIAPKSTEIQTNWFDARLYCFSLNIDGKTGWRLPTMNELFYITEYMPLFHMTSGLHWSSQKSMHGCAHAMYYSGGGADTTNCSSHTYTIGSSLYVRAVRDLKDDL